MNKQMTLNEYQQKAMTTCMDSCDNFAYMMLNLMGEVGEFASKVAKQIRKEHKRITDNGFYPTRQHPAYDDTELRAELKKEAGDILWQLAGLCRVMGWDLEDVAQGNLDKLAARKEAGTIDGSGDGIIRGK
jgi:NTP pyrophosphatase (non-canonical NTP hydrolase)